MPALVIVPSETSASAEDWQVNRRADWRFLLSDPRLGRAASSSAEPVLLASMQKFSQSLTIVTEWDTCSSGAYDTIVMTAPSLDEVIKASRCLKGGGYLYIEQFGASAKFVGCPGATWARCLRGLTFPLSDVRRLGFDTLQLYWPRPNAAQPKQLVPLLDPKVVAFALERDGSGGVRGLLRLAASVLSRLGLLARLLPNVSVIARKQE